MEPRFGFDFSQMRVHADSAAALSARAVGSLAYTLGRHVVFAAGQYAPHSTTGRQLLAHELSHVVQNGGSPRSGYSAPRVGERDCAEERQADQYAATLGTATNHANMSGAPLPIAPRDAAPVLRRQIAPGARTELVAGEPQRRLLARMSISASRPPPDLAAEVLKAFRQSRSARIEVLAVYPDETSKGAGTEDAAARAWRAADGVATWLQRALGAAEAWRIRPMAVSRRDGPYLEVWLQQPQTVATPGDVPRVPVTLPPELSAPPPSPEPDRPVSPPTPEPRREPAMAAPRYLAPYPGTPTDAFQAFLETPDGQRFKEWAKRQGKHIFVRPFAADAPDSDLRDLFIIFYLNLALLSVSTGSFFGKFSTNQRAEIIGVIVRDRDVAAQRPAPEKTWLKGGITFDPDLQFRGITTPIMDKDFGATRPERKEYPEDFRAQAVRMVREARQRVGLKTAIDEVAALLKLDSQVLSDWVRSADR